MPPIKADYAPESYNQLRKELHDSWPDLWKRVQWFMAFDWALFIENMNMTLDLRVPFETDVDLVCKIYLKTLQQLRRRLH